MLRKFTQFAVSTRKDFMHVFPVVLTVLVGTLICPIMSWAEETPSPRPNVVLVLTDDQGFGDLSLHGNPHLKTPHIDGLAKSGVQFERFYVNSFCAPTRAALLTGRYPLRTGVFGVTHNKEAMRTNETTIAESLKTAGYRTTCIGKWHNGEQYPYTPPGQGFDEFFGFHNGHINNYFNTTLIRGSEPVATQGYISDVLTDEAIRFIQKNKASPFFCYLSFNAPHSPYQVPDKYYDKFRKKGLAENVSAFYGMCENIDDNVGRLLAELEKLSLAENTIVLFLTDNGGTAGVKIYNAGMRGGKTSVHEGGCRVPLFVRWPKKLKKPHVVKALASHIDLYPTVLDLCGVTPPKGLPVDGVSLRPLLEGQSDNWPERVLFTHNPISATNQYPGAVRTPRYRLVRTIRGRQGGSSATQRDKDAPPWQLFNMEKDPGEKTNIAKDHPQVVKELSQLYDAWVEDTRKPGLKRLPLSVGYREENPVTLNAPQAHIQGDLQFDHGPGFAHDWISNWSDKDAEVAFDLDVAREGVYEVSVQYATEKPRPDFRMHFTSGSVRTSPKLPAQEAPIIPLPHRDQRSRERYVNRDWKARFLARLHLSKGPKRFQLTLGDLPDGQSVDFKALVLKRLEK